MSIADVESALNTQLATVCAAYDIAWENVGDGESGPFIPTVGTPFLEAYFLPARPSVIEITNNGRTRYDGIFQVDINVPAYEGKYRSDVILKLLENGFSRGTVLTYNSVNIMCLLVFPSRPYDGEGWYTVPVNITWQSEF